jgi:preprotein translocase subunit SecD
MFKDIRVRAIFTVVVTLATIVYLLPTLVPDIPPSLKPYLPKDKIRLGLDLQGGMHLVLEVDTEKAVENHVERMSNNLKETLMDRNVRFKNLDRISWSEISVQLQDKEAGDEFGKVLRNQFPDLEIKKSEIVDGKETTYLELRSRKTQDIKKFAVEQSLETIRNRVDQFGVSEPEIVPQGEDRILIQLPGI